jgi:hypothetical protein
MRLSKLFPFVALVAVTLFGCSVGPPCTVGTSDCDGNAVRVCGTDGDNATVMDCASVARSSGGAWSCGTLGDAGPSTCVRSTPIPPPPLTSAGLGASPTPDQVRAFYAAMTQRFGATLIDKSDSVEMQLVADFLGSIGVMDRRAFLANYTTTLGHRIYVPFEPGVAAPGWDLWYQIVVLTHECQHIVQYDKIGSVQFDWLYVSDKAARARFEAQAYRSQLELQRWHYGQLESSSDVAARLAAYAVKSSDLPVAAEILESGAAVMEQDGRINEATVAAIEWLEANAPTLGYSGN